MDLLSELQHAEFKEAFDEFDKVSKENKTGLGPVSSTRLSGCW
jgi:hypothetical protein